MNKIFLPLIFAVIFSGCLLQPQISILSADYSDETISVNLSSNKELKEVKVRLMDLKENTLCEKAFDLKQGKNKITLNCALSENQKSVFVEVVFEGFVVSRLIDVSFVEEIEEEIETQESDVQERVFELAGKTLEGEVLEMYEENFENSDACTEEIFIQRTRKYQDKLNEFYPSGYKYNLDNLTVQQKTDLKEKINTTKKCKIQVKKELNELGNEKYLVKYSLNADGECKTTTSQEDTVVIQVDLSSNSVEVIKGAMSNDYTSLEEQKKMFDSINEMGECLKAMVMGITLPFETIPIGSEPIEIQIEPILIKPISIKPVPVGGGIGGGGTSIETNNLKDATILHRTVRNCASDQGIKAQEFIPLKDFKGVTQYTNYTCRNRKEQQCSFSQQTKVIVDFDFDEGQGNKVTDNINGLEGIVENPEWVEGKTGQALKFNGNSYVKILDNRLFDVDQYTIEAWVKLTKPVEELPGSYQTILSKEHDYIFRFANGHDEKGTGRIFSTVHFAGWEQHANAYFPEFNYTGGGYSGHETKDVKLDTGRWYKMEMAYDGTYLTLKIDNKVVSRTKTTKPRTHSTHDLYIGAHIGGIDKFIGVIDEVKISGLQKTYNAEDTYYDESCEWKPLLPYSKEYATTLHRVTKNCDDRALIKGPETIKLKDKSGNQLYTNFTCANRYTEQCIQDGTRDTYYEEWCDFNPQITPKPIEIEIEPIEIEPIIVDLNIYDWNITDLNKPVIDLNITDLNIVDLNIVD